MDETTSSLWLARRGASFLRLRHMLLEDKCCVITGAASRRGLGMATAKLFASEGARVAILDLDTEQAKAAAAEVGNQHVGLACNVADLQQCKSAIDEVLGTFGGIDVLVNNAGITQPLKLMEIKPENYEAVTDVSLRGSLYMSQAVVPHMRERKSGSIICLSSVSAQRGGGIFGGGPHQRRKGGVRAGEGDGARTRSGRHPGEFDHPGLIQTDITAGKLTDDMKRRS